MKNKAIKVVKLLDISVDDLRKLVKLDELAVEKYGISYSNEMWTIENFVYELPNKYKYSFVLIVNDKIVGFCIASLKNNSIYIHRFLVKKNPDNLAKVFFRQLIINYSGRNIVLMVNNHNENAINFYKYFDFQFIKDRKTIKEYISKELIVNKNLILIGKDYQCCLMIKKR